MTEKEFLSRAYDNDRQSLLALAKEAGAKFDPEPVELPRIFVADDDLPTPVLGFSVGNPGKGFAVRRLSSAQLGEVVRRCNAWPELLRLYRAGRVYDIAKILEGSR